MNFVIQNWAVWSPELKTDEDVRAWSRGERDWGRDGDPDVTFLPASLRRRMTRLSKIGLYAAHHALGGRNPADVHTVFASRYGENLLTTRLLLEMAQGEEMSPMGFSMSVHNTTSGLFSITEKSQAPSTAVAGFRDSFFNGVIEALGQMEARPEIDVLLVINEEPIHEIYQSFIENLEVPYGLALYLTRGGAGVNVRGTLGAGRHFSQSEKDPSELPQALKFLKWMLSDAPSVEFDRGARRWTWEKV